MKSKWGFEDCLEACGANLAAESTEYGMHCAPVCVWNRYTVYQTQRYTSTQNMVDLCSVHPPSC